MKSLVKIVFTIVQIKNKSISPNVGRNFTQSQVRKS